MTAPLAMPRQPYWSLNSLIAAPILVPPDQSGAASPAFASMVSGVAFTSVAVSRVSLVAKVNTSGLLDAAPRTGPPLMQYSSMSSARA
jgi:hypothetical protein